MMGGGVPGAASGYALGLNMGIWDFTWRTLAFIFGMHLDHPGAVAARLVHQMAGLLRAGAGAAESVLHRIGAHYRRGSSA